MPRKNPGGLPRRPTARYEPEFLQELHRAALEDFRYCAATGHLYRRRPAGRRWMVGEAAGCAVAGGKAWHVGWRGHTYTRAQLVVLYHIGAFPVGGVQHYDRDPLNDRFENLLYTHPRGVLYRGHDVAEAPGKEPRAGATAPPPSEEPRAVTAPQPEEPVV